MLLQEFENSMDELKTIELELQKVIHRTNYREFPELLKRVGSTKKLDLTHWTIDDNELKILLDVIKEEELLTASLIGLKPIEHRQRIFHALKEKSNQQNNPIFIKYAQGLDDHLTKKCDPQFQQQKWDSVEVSMAFKPLWAGANEQGVATNGSQIITEIQRTIRNSCSDSFAIHVTGVNKLNNSEMEQKFAKMKQRAELNKPLPQSYLAKMQTIQISDIRLDDGEMLLYHGTVADNIPLIATNGYDETHVCPNGDDFLGNGIYFSSELSKSAVLSRCSTCGVTEPCFCYNETTMQPHERIVLLNRVYVGNAEVLAENHRIIEYSDSFDSCIVLSKELEHSTEIFVPNGAPIIPLYKIRFTVTPNYLLVNNWDKALERNDLALISDMSFQSLFKRHYESLKEVNQLINNNSPMENYFNMSIKMLQHHGQKIFQKLLDMKNRLESLEHHSHDPRQQQIKKFILQFNSVPERT